MKKNPVDFYPRPPRGGRPSGFNTFLRAICISIHALREEGDTGRYLDNGSTLISIHALREEGDRVHRLHPRGTQQFLSTPSARRATSRSSRSDFSSSDFYPRPPRGGRQQLYVGQGRGEEFLSTPSARRATAGGRKSRKAPMISIHALREEGDAVADHGSHAQPAISIHALREEGD